MGRTDFPPPLLPSAVHIATQRVRAMPGSTFKERMDRAIVYQIEVQRAKRELAQGEWKPVAS